MSKTSKKSPVSTPSRRILEWPRITLFTRAGGRCEFDGCPRYLLEHHVTFTEGNFVEFAHIVAFSEDGPRGSEPRPEYINDISNLMLLCPTCHKLIDDNPDKFTRKTLEEYKKNHEKQILYLTGLRPELKTSILQVKSKIGDQTVDIPFDHIMEAIAPRYPLSKDGLTIDLTQLSTKGNSFTKAACEAIDSELTGYLSVGGEARKSHHISLFALAPMPVLMYLGNRLSNKLPVDLFQRHRGDEKWTWKSLAKPVEYSFNRVRTGTDSLKVALILSLSGVNREEDLPPEIDKEFSIYEISLSGLTPNPTFLQSRENLEAFKKVYHETIAAIFRDHQGIKTIDIFPAVPAPIAVLCGRELLPKVHPALKVYDKDKGKGGFIYQLTINQ